MKHEISEQSLFQFIRVSENHIVIRRYDDETDSYKKVRSCRSFKQEGAFLVIDQSFHYLHDGQLLQLTQNEPCREQDFEVLLSGTGKFAHNVVKVLKCTNERLPFKYVVLARCGG